MSKASLIIICVLLLGAVAVALSMQTKSAQGTPLDPLPEIKDAPSKDVAAAARGNNAFALAFLKTLDKDGNLFYSPYSISAVLAMTYAGARGQTAAEMEQAMRFRLKGEKLHAAWGTMIRAHNAEHRRFQLYVANRLFGEDSAKFQPEFLALNANMYGAPLQRLDFIHAPDACREKINEWVAERTQQRIKDIIPAGEIDKDTRLVLANAIYFRGTWEKQFKPKNTHKRNFTRADGSVVKVPLMSQTWWFKFAEVDGVKIIDLPYSDGDELVMTVLLPDKYDGLPALERSLDEAKLKALIGQLREQEGEVDVVFPKFKLTWGTKDLKESLQRLGIKRAFSEVEAEFQGICSKPPVYIEAVLHKAFIAVDEEGTEAAAAAMGIGVMSASDGRPRTFIADHPFLFFIRDTERDCILFAGRMASPQLK